MGGKFSIIKKEDGARSDRADAPILGVVADFPAAVVANNFDPDDDFDPDINNRN